jgi:hypothetical protein
LIGIKADDRALGDKQPINEGHHADTRKINHIRPRLDRLVSKRAQPVTDVAGRSCASRRHPKNRRAG